MSSMKYLLKKDEQDKGVLCDKVTIDGFDYYVSDDEITQGNYYIDFRTDGNKLEYFKEKDDWMVVGICGSKKVIATNNPNIDLPKVVDEVEVILDAIYPKIPSGVYGHTLTAQKRDVFSEGYNKSQSTHPNSDEDMIAFSEWVTVCYPNQKKYLTTNDKRGFYSTEELLQRWKSQQPKVIYYHD